EAQRRAAEETVRLEELEAIRSRIEEETRERAETEQHLNEGLKALRKAETLQLQRIAAAQAESKRLAEETIQCQAQEEARLEAEAEERQRAREESIRAEENRIQQQAQEEEQHTAQLDGMRSAAEN